MSQQSNHKAKGFWGNTFTKLKSALSKTKEAVVDSVVAETEEHSQLSSASIQESAELLSVGSTITEQVASSNNSLLKHAVVIDSDFLDDLEDKLIKADLGLSTVDILMEDLRQSSKGKEWTGQDVQSFLKEEFIKMLALAPNNQLRIKDDVLNIILVVGVNGTGKTTSIGKLCRRFQSMNKKVLIAAGDTFRAAAESQLEIWAQRSACDLLRLASGADPGAVVFQALKKAKEEKYDVLVIDTAGRLHNKADLMAELRKIQSVIDKNADGANFEALLVLDASTGQNGVQQARLFSEVCPLTGVILTKLDGSAKGGIVFGVANELKIPVKLIGLGEKIDDLQDFEPELFIEALFD
jgi:fused signal recognition particle receptor